ncbi:NADAR family protein [Anabaena sp. UHCC 0204]|uniref:NADAR family protein n=1 Tax=Anabaena sp. UHCC 0204 TaxID=2590009 RepID=UPI0014489F89|nr:NADAR family protein [Anabaena sp. UHCC 0204]MTJ06891.1 DUF1768 domain-containing protein [Anabaena sp. UHCC 0204]
MVAALKLPESRTYNRQDCITFRKTAERFGGLSNMAGGYPLFVNGVRILTSEALYQACRFPHIPDVQRLIIAERSPMTAKMRSKPYRDNSRVDWDLVRTKIMRWCLQVKLIQNWEKFSSLLLETENQPIVEDSRKDDFWGAKPVDEEILIGINVLGRLLMQLREQVKTGEITSQTIVRPLSISNFLLYEREINPVSRDGECYLDSNAEVSVEVDKEVASQLTPEVVLLSEDKYEIVGNKNDAVNSIVEIESDFNKYDAFHIVLPHLEELLNTEFTDKELAERLNIPLTLMRTWLERAVKLGKVSKLRKPVRYVLECQLSLLNQM